VFVILAGVPSRNSLAAVALASESRMLRMEGFLGVQTWWSMALDRQRSLAITSPLQQLDGAKSHIGAQRHDIRMYCLYVIDQIALGMRAQRGERLDVIERALNDLIEKCEPQASVELHGRIVTWVIEGLHMANLKEIVTSESEGKAALEQRLRAAQEARDFFDQLPWEGSD
jgi:hypothetical protein